MNINQLLDDLEWTEEAGDPPEDKSVPYVTHTAILVIDPELPLTCYRLSNGDRVFNGDDIERFLVGGGSLDS